MSEAATIWTIGHSTHTAEEFAKLLVANGICVLADIRRFPTSRWPQFKQDNLRAFLAAWEIDYVHIPELGGYRGDYVAHTGSEEFLKGMEHLLSLAHDRRTAMMCAEAVFFRCHRRFVADVLVGAGNTVLHIFPNGTTQPHQLRPRIDEPEAGGERPGPRTRLRTPRR